MRTKDDNKRLAIRHATVQEAIQSGLKSASVARIAARAGVSAGTIYLYFPNKEMLLQEVYIDIKLEFHRVLMGAIVTGGATQAGSAQNLRAMWFAMQKHLEIHANDFVFSELVGAARLLDAAHQAQVEQLGADIVRVLQTAVADGTLCDLPLDTLRALLVSPANFLARQAAAKGVASAPAVVAQTFDAIWRAIAK